MAYISWFGDLGKSDVGIAGGKGANLGEMYRAGFPVPPGFVVTSNAYFDFIKEADLKNQIQNVIKNTNIYNPEELQKASDDIERMIINAKMPKDVEKEVRRAYKTLRGKESEFYVAVRSSATAEDLPEASFAGEQKSFLNIDSEDGLIEAVQKCWASLFEARAIFYREEQGFGHTNIGIAVVVQEMVQSERSGVIFTIDPVSGNDKVLVIEAAYGLGEAVVSGAITPDTYTVDKATLTIIDKHISEQKFMITKIGAETKHINVKESIRDEQKLDDLLIVELARIGKKIEEYYGKPQDIEWAVVGKKVYIVQSRPVTALKKKVEQPEVKEVSEAKILVKGFGATTGASTGKVRIIPSPKEIGKVESG
ncbi:MAG: PEP/pyruvate-binding domain-containing protein, partial [Candidatus Micrarchaeia archaeon]